MRNKVVVCSDSKVFNVKDGGKDEKTTFVGAILLLILLFTAGCGENKSPATAEDDKATITKESLAPYVALLGQEDDTVVAVLGEGELDLLSTLYGRIYDGSLFGASGKTTVNYSETYSENAEDPLEALEVISIIMEFDMAKEDAEAKIKEMRSELKALFGDPRLDNGNAYNDEKAFYVLNAISDMSTPEITTVQFKIIDAHPSSATGDAEKEPEKGTTTYQKEPAE